MAKAHFRFSTEILRRLGEELNPRFDQGVLELVKNSYDADAKACLVELSGGNESEFGELHIVDDGIGMSADDIMNGWLVLGSSGKNRRTRTKLGRIPAGDKGLGRLAALRLGSKVRLTSYPKKDKNHKYQLEIDWSKYEKAKIVDDIDLEIVRSKRNKGDSDGVEITITDLHKPIKRSEVVRLVRSLILLADPFSEDSESFNPYLELREYQDLENLLEKRYFEFADYHLVASTDNTGIAKAKVVDWKGKQLYEAGHSDISSDKQGYKSKGVSFELWNFVLNKQSFSTKSITISEAREWLKSFGGVHLYENGLRVEPYGNPGNDWLDMNVRRVQSPEERPSTNNSIGKVVIQSSNDLFIQKTDRSGFIETEEFDDLRQFANDALEWMARRRLEEAEKRRSKEKQETKKQSRASTKKIAKVIDRAPRNIRADLSQAVEAQERSFNKEIATLKKEVQLYRTLSTAGIVSATFAHEARGNPIKAISLTINNLRNKLRKNHPKIYKNEIEEYLERIRSSLDSLSVLGTVTLSLLDQSKRRAGRVDINPTIEKTLKLFSPLLENRRVIVQSELSSGNPYFRGSKAALESVVTNLINNSLNALEGMPANRRTIKIITVIQGGEILQLKVLDSGMGLEDVSLKDIWLPGFTTQQNGTGLGLTIVKDVIEDLSGSVHASKFSDLGGAEFIVELPIIGF